MARYDFALFVKHDNNDKEFIFDWVTLTSDEITSHSSSSVRITRGIIR